MMIQYKNKYCIIRQYMPEKPTKWKSKVCCLTVSETRYVWTFEFIVKSTNGVPGIKGFKNGWAMQCANVVHILLRGLENRGHVVIIDKLFFFVAFIYGFSFVKIFMQRAQLGPIALASQRH